MVCICLMSDLLLYKYQSQRYLFSGVGLNRTLGSEMCSRWWDGTFSKFVTNYPK